MVTLESEKATVELTAPESGTLTQILKEKGEVAKVGEIIGYLAKGSAADRGGDTGSGCRPRRTGAALAGSRPGYGLAGTVIAGRAGESDARGPARPGGAWSAGRRGLRPLVQEAGC